MPHLTRLPRTPENVVALLAEIAPPLLDARLPARHCVPGTRVGLDVLSHFGVTANPCVTRTAAGNSLGLRMLDALTRGRQFHSNGHRLPRLISCGFDLGDDAVVHDGEYDRHLVILVQDRILVDITVGSFSQAGAPVPPAIISHVNRAFREGRSAHTVRASQPTTIRYERDISHGSYASFRSWQGLDVTEQLTRWTIGCIAERLEPAESAAVPERRRCA